MSSARPPVTLDTTGSVGACSARPSATSRNSASTGSRWVEWNAWLVRSRFTRRPRPLKCAATASTSVSSPDTTVAVGPLTAAMSTAAPNPTTSASVARRETISPSARADCISRPRAATRVAASGSENTPATCAAASSPMEWPSRKSGRTPQCSSSRKSATSTANSAGWVYSVRSSAVGSWSNTTSRSGRSSSGSNAAQTASNASV